MERAYIFAKPNIVMNGARVLVHLATGIGNIVLATPLLLALRQQFNTIELLVDADYPGMGELFRGWSALAGVFDGRAGERPAGASDIYIPAIPPFAWPRFAARYRGLANVVPRPADELFYQNEQHYYLEFAAQLGCRPQTPAACFLPVPPAVTPGITANTLILAPGCKTGEMTKKRWPYFTELAEAFDDVVVVGTADDLVHADDRPMRFPSHVRSLIDRLSLRELAAAIATGWAVVANDSGIGHIAAAIGTQTVLLFGPTPDRTLGQLPPNVIALRNGLACEPCWFDSRFAACAGRISCLGQLSPARVAAVLRQGLTQVAADTAENHHAV
jgi:ADP-heptose:LPS heptosyltransferase